MITFKSKLILSSLFFIFTVFQASAETPPPTPKERLQQIGNKAEETIQLAANTLGESKSRRENSDFLVLLNYSYLDLILPGKYGITLGWIPNARSTYEVEYLRGSLSFIIDEIGSMKDERFSITKRSFLGRNSFNVSYGLNYFIFGGRLSDEVMQSVSQIYQSSAREIETHLIGAHIGLSNRWTIKKNITIGVDWVSWSQPLFQVYKYEKFTEQSNDQGDKKDIERAMDIASYLPRLTFLKVQFGMSF